MAKVIYTDNSLEFGKACEDLSWNHCTSTPHRSETNGIAERAIRRVKGCTSAVLLQSGLDEKWWADSMQGFTYLRNIQYLLSDGKTHTKGVLGNHARTNHSVWFIGWVLPYFCERPLKNPSFLKESLALIVLWIRSVRRWNLEGWQNNCRHWGVGNDGRIGHLLKKTQCKGCNISQRKWKISCSSRRWTEPNFLEEIRMRTSSLIRERPIRGESHVDFLGESEGSLPPPHDSFPDAGEAINEFWSMSGNFIFRHHVETRVKLYSPKEESFPIPLKYIDVSRTAHTNLDVMQESRIDDYWNIVGSRDLSDSWTGFTQLLYEMRNLQTEIRGPGRHWQNGKRHPGHIIYGQNSGRNLEEMLSWGTSRNGQLKNQSSIMLEDYEEFVSGSLRKRNAKKPSRMLGRNWKRQWLPLCLARQAGTVSMARPVVNPKRSNQNWRVFWKPVNPQEYVWKNIYQITMRTRLQEEWDNSLQHHNLVHKFIPMPQAMKIPEAKAAVVNECEKLEKDSSVGLDKGQKQIRGSPTMRHVSRTHRVALDLIVW